MWLSSPSSDALARPRLAVVFLSAVAAASLCYYVYQAGIPPNYSEGSETVTLHRSNAVRLARRRSNRNGTASSSSSDSGGDDNAQGQLDRLPGDGETIVGATPDDWWNDPSGFPPSQRAGHNIVHLLFRVSEDNARRNGCVHRGCQCNACGMVPIRGVRYRCANCADFDLCETCEAQGVHIKTHVFYKIRVPAPPFGPRQMQPVWYTGDPDTCRRSLSRALIERLSKETGFERPELEAFWEQWTFMANTEWREDPDGLCVAMDRKTFERCLVPTGGSRHAAPNLIHDRMFSFYDSNHDDLIGFSEFLRGLSYRKRKDKLRKVFEGYDIDGDGFVDRRDFLRMFRAYYVLYKQMHKDILDGLEDQLLASTEAQQLVTSRQPLSSLFGREGRVPAGDSSLRFEGKTYHRDGSVDVEDSLHGAVAENRGDTASREDILASLFAYETDDRSHRRLVSRRDNDSHWRTVRRLSGNDAERAYLAALLEPPAALEALPDVLAGVSNPEIEESEDEADEGGSEDGDEVEADEGLDEGDGTQGRNSEPSGSARRAVTESERRARLISQSNRLVPQMERRRRDLARKQLHERWRRRQFYLDEEEGGSAPDDWEHEEDILVNMNRPPEGSKSADGAILSTRSRSSSKVRFAEDMDDYETRSNPSTSSRSVPERWGGMEIPDAERDAGKEILYQVTQQAFNELLDAIFKPSEDVAMEAAGTKAERDKHMTKIMSVELEDDGGENAEASPKASAAGPEKNVGEKSLSELLAETGYTVVEDEWGNAVGTTSRTRDPENGTSSNQASGGETEQEESVYRDPTMPQFRPNSNEVMDQGEGRPDGERATNGQEEDEEGAGRNGAEAATGKEAREPSLKTLRLWKRQTEAEARAAERGGWGRLSFDEFEQIYKSQEDLGNRLDYLGSWIDFCIP